MALTTDLYFSDGRPANWGQIRDYVLADFPRCAICGQAEATEVDHIWPRHFGGSDESENLQPTCGSCNRAKGSRVDLAVATDRQIASAIRACAERATVAVAETDRFIGELWGRAQTASDDRERVYACAQAAFSAVLVIRDELAIRVDLLRRLTDKTESYGPLVCECPEPDADPRRNFGECSRCRRKPLALMEVPK